MPHLHLGSHSFLGLGHNDNAMSMGNLHFAKKLPQGSEVANILIGDVDFLESPICAFVRLKDATMLERKLDNRIDQISEVNVPTRFIFILLAPPNAKNREVGRSIATILADEIFREVAYKAEGRSELLAGLDEFLDSVTVLPPGEWDPSIRIEPPSKLPDQHERKTTVHKDAPPEIEVDEEEEANKIREESGLTRSGRLFGGLINDIKRKAPHYLSDYKDAIHMQTLASFIFIYFACLTPIVTFGGLLGDATDNNIAAMESLVSGLICGVLFGLFAGQPLNILGSTGPILVFETIVFDFCKSQEWAYLSFRLWIGVWIAFLLIVLVAVDGSAFVCYITRFTEENFATLIAVIFIIKAIEKLVHIDEEYLREPADCYCIPNNMTEAEGWNYTQTIIPNKGSLYTYSKLHDHDHDPEPEPEPSLIHAVIGNLTMDDNMTMVGNSSVAEKSHGGGGGHGKHHVEC